LINFPRTVCTVVAGLLCLSLLNGAPVHAATKFGDVSKLTGTAKVQRGSIGPWLNIAVSKPIYTGDRAVTGDNCRMEIKLSIGGILRVEENTQIDFEERPGGIAGVQVWLGRVWSSITKVLTPSSKFEVSTPTAVAAVRGTEFFVDVEGSGGDSESDSSAKSLETEIGVLEGEVEVVDLAEQMSVMEQHGGKLEGPASAYSLRLESNESLRLGNNRMMQRQFSKPIDTVAVLPFRFRHPKAEKPAPDSGMGMKIATHFSEGLERAARGRFTVVSPAASAKKLASQSPVSVDFFHPNAFASMAREARWDAIVTGVIFDLPEHATTGQPGLARPQRQPAGSGQQMLPSALGFSAEGPEVLAQQPAPRPRSGERQPKASAAPANRKMLALRLILATSGAEVMTRNIPLTALGEKGDSRMKQEMMNLANTITRSMPTVAPVIKVEGDMVTLTGGTHSVIQVGDRAVILKKDAEWTDPQTGKRLGRKMAAVIEITRVEARAAIARIIKTIPNVQVQPGDIAVTKLPGEERADLRARVFDKERLDKDAWFQWNRGQR